MGNKFIFSLIILLFVLTDITANISYRFHTFSPEGGFHYNGISSIVQDKNGIIWFITDNSLYRFDGYDYKSYHSSFPDSTIPFKMTSQFNDLAVDSNGNIFVGTDSGLYSYNKHSDNFRKISSQIASSLYADSHGKLWISRQGFQQGFLSVFDVDKDIYTPIYEEGSSLETTSFAGDHVSLFISINNKIFRYDYESEVLNLFYSFENDTSIQSIVRNKNKLWVLIADRGLTRIDIPSGRLEYTYDFFYHKNKNLLTKKICADKNGLIWIGTQKGLYILNPDTGNYTLYTHSKADLFSIPNNSVWSIYSDNQENIWIGTYSGGLCYVNLDESIWMKSYVPLESPLNHNLVSGFAEDKNNLWIATEGGGLNCMNKLTGEFIYLTSKSGKSNNSLSYDNTKSVVCDSGKQLWIAMFRGGMDCYDTKTGNFTHFKHNSEDGNSLLSNNLRKLLAVDDKGLWIIYQLKKTVISYYSFKDKTFTHYTIDDKPAFIYDICANNDNLWLVSESLYKFNLMSQDVKKIDPPNGILNAGAVCMDGNNNLWITTVGCGLIRFNTISEDFSIYDDILKQNAYSIFSACMDNDNNLWLGTDNGLFIYNIAENRYQRFEKQDGIQGQVFYPLSSFKSQSGELYFGGTNGFTVLNPRLMKQNTRPPRVMMLNFYIDNNISIPPTDKNYKDSLSFPGQIILKHNQSSFGFSFSGDNYMTPGKNRFRYRLKGYDERWTETNASVRSAFYAKIPSGEYQFEVMTSNNNGVWSEKPLSITVKRLPAPWLSWPAYLLYTLIFGCIVFYLLRHYHTRRKMKLQLYLESVDKQKKEEIHTSQLRFFTNISHDFRTPLFLIIAVLEKLKETGWKPDYYRILNSNTQRLLNLVNELMDFRKIENGKMPLQIKQVNVNHLVNAIAYDFRNYATQKEISFTINCDENLPAELYADKHILEKILLNLLNNAFKYTSKGGEVSVETYHNPDSFKSDYTNSFTVEGGMNPDNPFLIVVRDNGIGISKESISSVFERFYKVNTNNADSHLGTGIGLALVKSLVLLHKGTLTIYSEREKGTDMVVYLSGTPSLYTNTELDIDKFLHEQAEPALELKETEEEKLLSEKKRVLLVEDNDDLRALIADSLSVDYEVIEAENGLIASELIKEKEVALIISDIMMPVKDGITLCRELKEDINLSHIPFILLTAKTGIDSKLEGVDSGADLYFEKPVDSRLLRASIQNVFNSRKKLQEYYAKNYFADTSELAGNKQDREFLKRFIDIVEKNLDQPNLDVNYIASSLNISRAKLYNKVKALTNKSTIEFILNYRLRKAARLLVEENLSIREIMILIGIESQSYFTSVFKKEFKETPTAFAKKYKKN